MFTGIVSSKAEILDIDNGCFKISCDDLSYSLKIGQSVAHDGACMTVDKIQDKSYTFFAMNESFLKTNFSKKQIGDFFNIELCLKADDRLDGHFVTGHIDVIGSINQVEIHEDGSKKIQISFDKKYDSLVVPKGSVALNGVSLTVVDVEEGGLSVWLIPLTQTETNLGALEIGDFLNIEFDLLAKYITKFER